MLVNFLVGILAVLVFLFIFWKRLNEDYSSDIIFQVGTYILIGMAVGLTASKLFFQTWFFWMSALGVMAGMGLMLLKFKLRFFETLEAVILASMPVISLMFFTNSIASSSLNSFIAFVVCLILIFLSYWFDVNYRNFTWYKSGKIGFAGLMVAILFFLARTVVAILGISMVSFVGKFEPIFSGISFVISVVLLMVLGKKKE